MTAPLIKNDLQLDVTSLTTAMDYSAVVGRAPYACVVTAVEYIPNGTQAGGATVANARALGLVNRGGGAGTGTTTIAAMSMTTTGTSLTDNVPASLSLTTTPLLTLAAGDVLEWNSAKLTTGLNDPGGKVVVTYSRI